MSVLWMTSSIGALLAQSEFDDWKSLLYILIVLILPLLSSLGAWIRKRSGKELGGPADDLEDISEDEIILLPEEPLRRSPIPQARPAIPPRSVTVAPPVASPARPAVRPAAPPPPAPVRPVLVPASVLPGESPGLRVARRRRAEGPLEVARVPAVSGPPLSAARVELGTLTPEELQRAVVLREVLGPPVALRPSGEASWER